jgi:hypothetical protein
MTGQKRTTGNESGHLGDKMEMPAISGTDDAPDKKGQERTVADLSETASRDFSRFGAGIGRDRMGRRRPERPRGTGMGAALGPRRTAAEPPPVWSVPHVFDRICEALETLGRLPMVVKPRGYANSMPAVAAEVMSNKDWIDAFHLGDLELEEDEKNRVRLPPTRREISRLEQALDWPLQYLADQPELSRAVLLAALWHIHGTDPQKACYRRGLVPRTFRKMQIEALGVIVGKLTKARTPVE